ncbi:uncharacterized protein [Branchiostoma lanceolatum]|uniref:uncharacterized protein n=1 Tax=Branchiostoma lanceolatum TaxID=7740 RepID=UPI003454F48B
MNPSQPWTPNTTTKLCSRHFVYGRKSDIPGSAGYIPTIFESKEAEKTQTHVVSVGISRNRQSGPKESTPAKAATPKSATTANKDILKSANAAKVVTPAKVVTVKSGTSLKRRMEYETSSHPSSSSSSQVGRHPPPDDQIRRQMFMGDEKAVWSTTDHDYIKTQEEKTVNMEEVRRVQMKLEELKAEHMRLKKAALCLENIKDHPGILRFWTGFPNYRTFMAVFNYLKPKAADLHVERGEATLDNELGDEGTVSLEEEFFVVMTRLRIGVPVSDASARLLIKPDHLTVREQQLYSNYKHETIKFLIGVSSHSLAVTYYSACFGDRASEVLLESLKAVDSVSADKGSTMHMELKLSALGIMSGNPDSKGVGRSQLALTSTS